MASTRTTRKLLSFRFLFLLFLIGIDYLPSRTYNPSLCSLSSRSHLSIGVRADVVLMSTFVEVTETVPPPAATATAPAAVAAPASDGNAPAVQATEAATNTAVAIATATAAVAAANTGAVVSVTASVAGSLQPTASGGEQAMVQVPGTTAATSTAAAATTEPGTLGASTSTNPGEVQVSGLAGTKTAFVSMSAAPSGITTSIRGKASPIATSTPSPTSTSTSTSSSMQRFPTYAAGLASGTAIIAAAGAFTAIYLIRRRSRRHSQRRRPSPVNETGQVNNRPFSIRKVSEVMSMTNLNLHHKPSVSSDGNKLTSMKPPPDIDPETSWPRGYVPPDPEELRERMNDEKRRSGGREGFDSAVDLGIGYVSSAGSAATPGDKRDGYFDGYSHEKTRPLSGMSMPEHMKPFMTSLQPRHTQDSVPEPVDRLGAISPASSVYSRRPTSVITSFGDIHAKIDGNNNNFNPQREEYRLRKEQAQRQFGSYAFVEEEESDHWSEPNQGLEEGMRPESRGMEEYSNPYTAQHSTASPVDDYFSMQCSTVNKVMEGQHDDYFSPHHSAVTPGNRESQYEDIDLSQNDSYADETTNGNKRGSGGYFGRLFGMGSRR